MTLQRTIEPNWTNLLYAVYAEEKDNSVKINAEATVEPYMLQGAFLKKVEDRESGVFVGIEVYLNDVIVFSKFRKTI